MIAQPLAMVVSASTDRPNGARLVANYLLSHDAQAILASAGRVPSRADVDPEPQLLVRGLKPQVTLPPEGQAERELRDLWQRALAPLGTRRPVHREFARPSAISSVAATARQHLSYSSRRVQRGPPLDYSGKGSTRANDTVRGAARS